MRKVYRTRWEFIEQYVHGKSVLDVGSAELLGTIHQHKEKESVHKRITDVAKKVIGLDINAVQVHALRERGYNIFEANAETFDLGQTFDVVVAGELIEHLSNPGAFLECTRRHLNENGTLVVTTPNRFSSAVFLSALLNNIIPSYNKPIDKHVAYYDENCLQELLRRHEYKRFTVAYYEWVGRPAGNIKVKTLNAILRRIRPRFLAGLMIAAKL